MKLLLMLLLLTLPIKPVKKDFITVKVKNEPLFFGDTNLQDGYEDIFELEMDECYLEDLNDDELKDTSILSKDIRR